MDLESAKAMLLSRSGEADWEDYKAGYVARMMSSECRTNHCVYNRHLAIVCLVETADEGSIS